MRSPLKKRPILLALPFAVMLVSGCIEGVPCPSFLPFCSQTVVYEGDILVVTDLQAIPAEVSPGQTTTIIATIQNRGTKKMTAADKIEVELYDYCPGLFQMVDAPKPITEIYPDQLMQVAWKLRASDGLKVESTCPSDGMKVAVRYEYATDSIATIAFIDEAEMNRLIQEGKFGKTQSSVTVGEGPVKPYIEVRDTQPIPSNSKTSNIVFQAKIVGSGFVPRDPAAKDGINPVVKWVSVASSDKNIQKGLDKCKKDHADSFVLIGGKSAEIPCEIEVVPRGDVTEYTETVTTSIGYAYDFRKSVMVKVRPKR